MSLSRESRNHGMQASNTPRFLDRRWAFLLPLLALVAVFWTAGPIDDDYICFRYARNWIGGHGLVYNVGERIEGYSQPLWVLIASGCELVGFVPEIASKLIGVTALILALGCVACRSPRTAFFLACLPGLAFHAVAGLGTTTFAALLVGALATWDWRKRGGWRALVPWVLFGFAGLARGEGLLWILPATIARLLEKRDPRVAIAWLGWAGWQLIARAWFYERFVPVTWDVKKLPLFADLGFGSRYLALGGWSSGYLVLIGLVLVLCFRRQLAQSRWPFVAGAGLHLLFVVYVGGDFVQFGRFWVPAVPLLGLLLASRTADAGIGPFRPSWGVAVLVLLPAWIAAVSETQTVFAKARSETARWVAIGRELDERLPERALIGTSPIGAIGYFSRRGIVDLLGLTNDKILHSAPDLSIPLKGHQRSNPAWVLRIRPHVLVLGNGRSFPTEGGGWTLNVSQWERGLLADRNFSSLYTQVAMPMPGGPPLLVFVRSDDRALIRSLAR